MHPLYSHQSIFIIFLEPSRVNCTNLCTMYRGGRILKIILLRNKTYTLALEDFSFFLHLHPFLYDVEHPISLKSATFRDLQIIRMSPVHTAPKLKDRLHSSTGSTAKLQFPCYRNTERYGLEETIKDHLVQPSCNGQEHLLTRSGSSKPCPWALPVMRHLQLLWVICFSVSPLPSHKNLLGLSKLTLASFNSNSFTHVLSLKALFLISSLSILQGHHKVSSETVCSPPYQPNNKGF